MSGTLQHLAEQGGQLAIIIRNEDSHARNDNIIHAPMLSPR